MNKRELKRGLELLSEHERWVDAHRFASGSTGHFCIKVEVLDSGPLLLGDYGDEVPRHVADAVAQFAAEKISQIEAELDALGVSYPRNDKVAA